jgi:hypothetical protein
MGHTDLMKIEDKVEFLKRMHQEILAKVYLKKGKDIKREKDEGKKEFNYHEAWQQQMKKIEEEKDEYKEMLKKMAGTLKHVPAFVKIEVMRMIDGHTDIREDVIEGIKKYKSEIKKNWPAELRDFVFKKVEEME